ncbi:MAG: ATPase, T2SS/T4P/T4SS family [Alphaproteobacteria bacterium]|nr:ATPase, T2SS/T4P/T4SS family [Alphaproteobacteria bacterium]MDD9920374.1 ATPase, T2SS/T4P/T4SS family [Alphaproteobacteria bacterium]
MSERRIQQAGSALSPELEAIAAKYGLNKVEARFLGPLLLYFERPNIREIVINRPGEVGYEYPDGSWEWISAPELTSEQLDDATRMLANMSGEVFTPTHPILACKMPGGHRVQVVAGHHTSHKFTMTVRIHHKKEFTIDDYNMPEADKEHLIDSIKNKKTILISGGTSTGKTSFMNAALQYIPLHERLITMEDVPELDVPHKNWAPLIFAGANKDPNGNEIKEILNACLRMRPDRILLGEIRKENAFAFCSAINTGHDGSMATIHANSPDTALDAVLNRVMLNGDIPESSLNVLKRQLEADIYGIVQLTRDGDRVTSYLKILEK